MKIAYVYCNEISSQEANINQTFNMLYSLGKDNEVTFFSNFISKKALNNNLRFFQIKKNFKIKKMFSLFSDSFKLTEFFMRFIYSIQTLITLKLGDFDVIYTRDFSFLLFCSYLPKWLKPKQKIIFENHTIYYLTSKKVSFNQEKKALNEADFFIPISKGVEKDLIGIFKVKKDKILVLQDGVNLENFTKIRSNINYIYKKYPLSKNKKIIVYTGSFKEWKGVDVLVKSSKFLTDKNIFYLIIGGKKEEIHSLNELIYKENLLKKNILLEKMLPQREVIKILKSSDVAIIPNKKITIGEKYTSPLKLFEYLACGLPIIASNLPSMKEVLKENQNALFFKTENEEDLANKIELLLKNKRLCLELKRNNIRLSKDYSWDSRANKITEVINHETNNKKTLQ